MKTIIKRITPQKRICCLCPCIIVVYHAPMSWGGNRNVFERGGHPCYRSGVEPRKPSRSSYGAGRQRVEESEYTRFESGTPLQMGWKTRSVGMHNGGRTFVNAATNARDVKRGRFAPVHHLWFGSSQQPRRGRIPWVFFRIDINKLVVPSRTSTPTVHSHM